MATILERKLFFRSVSITGGAAISLATLMRTTLAVTNTPLWGKNTDGTVSMDSFEANMCNIMPLSGIMYFGYDANVSDANTATTYKGSQRVVNTTFTIAAYCRGVIDAENVWLYSTSTQDINVEFVGF